MFDHIAACIRIGGTVPKRLVEDLCRAIRQEELALDWGEALFSPSTAHELLDVRTNAYGADVLQLYDDHARWGELADLEKFLIDHGIGFDRFHEAKLDINARLTQFRPESGRHDFNTSVEGHVVVPLQDVHYLRDDLHKVQQSLQKQQVSQAGQQLQAALDSLARRVRDPAPPLPSLEFSD